MAPWRAAEEPPESIAAGLKRRSEIPLGGNFKPNPKAPVLVAVGHGGRILLSRDDGRTWKQVFWGHAGSDHGPWATKAVAYTREFSSSRLDGCAPRPGWHRKTV